MSLHKLKIFMIKVTVEVKYIKSIQKFPSWKIFANYEFIHGYYPRMLEIDHVVAIAELSGKAFCCINKNVRFEEANVPLG